jgi:hypothetical protein
MSQGEYLPRKRYILGQPLWLSRDIRSIFYFSESYSLFRFFEHALDVRFIFSTHRKALLVLKRFGIRGVKDLSTVFFYKLAIAASGTRKNSLRTFTLFKRFEWNSR